MKRDYLSNPDTFWNNDLLLEMIETILWQKQLYHSNNEEDRFVLKGVALFEIENAIHFFKGHAMMRLKLEQYLKSIKHQEVIDYDAQFKTPDQNRFTAVPIILNYFLANLLKFRSKFLRVFIPCVERDETDYYAVVKDFKMNKAFLIVYTYKIASNVCLIAPRDKMSKFETYKMI